MPTPILEASDLTKSFGGMSILQGVSLVVKEGDVVSIFGDNGSGKTTLFHLLSGFLKPDAGRIRINGRELGGLPPIQFSRAGVGRIWQSPRVFRNVTVEENLLIAVPNHPGGQLVNYLYRREEIRTATQEYQVQLERVVADVGLQGKLGKTAGSLSLGEQKLLSIGMLLMQNALVLLLDEPFAGINPRMIERLSEILKGLHVRGISVLMIEHEQEYAMEISQHTYTLRNGKLHHNTIAP